ncbi:MAG: hypothetical protein NTX28_15840 [Novosphingobium sp.]|nr:hypothetical protein [Novosphingobium sp.]
MLVIDGPLFKSFENDSKARTMARIDQWLTQVQTEWASVALASRQRILPSILEEAEHAGLTCERDVAVFAAICVGLGEGWQARMREAKIAEVLSDPDYRPEAKLLWLGEVFHL